jgi:hypothetical protein
MSWPGNDHHVPCPCGAELADECPSCAKSNPFGSMRLDPIAERGLRNVRAAIVQPPVRDEDPDATRARAIAVARAARTAAKERP